MKFKIIFIIFNIISFFSLLFAGFLSFSVFRSDYFIFFWRLYWYYPAAFLLFVSILDIYFFDNWRFFQLLETEDWDATLKYLEKMVFNRKKIKRKYIKIITNLYLMKSALDKMTRLEDFLRKNRPRYILLFPLQFGIPYLLSNNPARMEEYYAGLLGEKALKERMWILWDYSFSLVLQKKNKEAGENFLYIIKSSREPILTLLSCYFLHTFGDFEMEMSKEIADGVRKLKKNFSRKMWDDEIEKSRNNIQAVIISRIVKEASEWMFAYSL